jgi:hypothetical protein
MEVRVSSQRRESEMTILKTVEGRFQVLQWRDDVDIKKVWGKLYVCTY